MIIKLIQYAHVISIIIFYLSGCGTVTQIQKTGHENEYVINRDDKSIFGTLDTVKETAHKEAINFCHLINKEFKENYSIDKSRAIMVWPETTLYFTCFDSKSKKIKE